MARYEMQQQNWTEEKWQSFAYKRKRKSDEKKLHPIMLAGTGSDVGKSVIAAALCRIFKQDGYQPAPFKAQIWH